MKRRITLGIQKCMKKLQQRRKKMWVGGHAHPCMEGINLEKTIYIDNKAVKLKATAALPKRYKAQFGRDYFADLMKVAKVFGKGAERNLGIQDISFASLDHMDMEVFYDIIWTMAKTADRTIPDPLEWLDGFEVFPLNEIMGEVKDLLTDTMPTSKKK